MGRQLPERLLVDRITVQRPVQAFVAGTKKPVFHYETVSTGIKVRFNPASTTLNRNVLGQVPKKSYRLFLNDAALKENDEIIWEGTGDKFRVTQVRAVLGHHFEVNVEEM